MDTVMNARAAGALPNGAAHAVPPAAGPRWSAVAREQVRVVGQSLELELAGLVMLMLLLTAIASGLTHDGIVMNFAVASMTWPVVLLGLVAPMAVWKGNVPSRRAYFWSMPVDRVRHTLARVLAGWVWLMVVVAAYVAWGAATAWFVGGSVGSGVHPSLAPRGTLGANPWMWLVPFAAATPAYLAGSIAAARSDRPWQSLIVSFFVVLLLVPMHWLVTEAPIIFGRYGLLTLLTGTVVLPGTAETDPLLRLPSAGGWALAVLIWSAVMLALLVRTTHRQGDR